jgi:hypothetical protein
MRQAALLRNSRLVGAGSPGWKEIAPRSALFLREVDSRLGPRPGANGRE